MGSRVFVRRAPLVFRLFFTSPFRVAPLNRQTQSSTRRRPVSRAPHPAEPATAFLAMRGRVPTNIIKITFYVLYRQKQSKAISSRSRYHANGEQCRRNCRRGPGMPICPESGSVGGCHGGNQEGARGQIGRAHV